MSLTQAYLTLAQGRFSFLQNSHKAGQAHILAVHGWLDNAASFTSLIEQMPNYNWTAVDLPGHGDSFHRSRNSHYHFIDWVSDLVDFITANYQSEVILVGHSLGGMLSSVIAGLYPELVSRLVLIDAAGLMPQSPGDGAKELRAALDSRVEQGKKDTNHSINITAAIRARAIAGGMSKQAAELLVKRNLTTLDGEHYWRSDNRLRSRSPIKMGLQQAQSVIQNIEAPVLILLAQDGYREIKQSFSHFQSFYQNLICKTVTGHHHCHMDNPVECAQLISRFLK